MVRVVIRAPFINVYTCTTFFVLKIKIRLDRPLMDFCDTFSKNLLDERGTRRVI